MSDWDARSSASISSVQKTRGRPPKLGTKPSEYRPVPIGGYAVYYNAHVGAQPLKRTLAGMDPTARGTKCLNVLKFGEDPKYKPYLLMLEHGIPLPSVWGKCIEAGLDPGHLLDDRDGPALNQMLHHKEEEEEEASEVFVKRAEEEGVWRAHANDWHLMQRSSVGMVDAPLLPRQPGLLQQQKLEHDRQAKYLEVPRGRAAEGHLSFTPMTDDINVVTAEDRLVAKARRNFPNTFSSRPLAYKTAKSCGIGAPHGFDVWGNNRPRAVHRENEFWRETMHGSVKELMGSYGASSGSGGFSLAVGARVPITWKTEKEMVDAWNKKKAM